MSICRTGVGSIRRPNTGRVAIVIDLFAKVNVPIIMYGFMALKLIHVHHTSTRLANTVTLVLRGEGRRGEEDEERE